MMIFASVWARLGLQTASGGFDIVGLVGLLGFGLSLFIAYRTYMAPGKVVVLPGDQLQLHKMYFDMSDSKLLESLTMSMVVTLYNDSPRGKAVRHLGVVITAPDKSEHRFIATVVLKEGAAGPLSIKSGGRLRQFDTEYLAPHDTHVLHLMFQERDLEHILRPAIGEYSCQVFVNTGEADWQSVRAFKFELGEGQLSDFRTDGRLGAQSDERIRLTDTLGKTGPLRP